MQQRSSLLHRDLCGSYGPSDRCRAPQDDIAREQITMTSRDWSVELQSANCSDRRMACLCSVLHRPAVLADGASAGTEVAREGTLAVPRARAGVDHHVDRHRRDYGALACGHALLHAVGVAARCPAICGWYIDLSSRGSAF